LRFKPLHNTPRERTIAFTFDGRALEGVSGQSLAAALLESGIVTFRKSRDNNEPRGPYCLMGTCFECLVHVEGIGTCQACVTPINPGMRVTSG